MLINAPNRSARWTGAALFALALLVPTISSADTLAGLQTEIGPDVDALVRGDLEAAINEVLTSAGSWDWTSTSAARQKLDPVVRDCFTVDCLTKAGAALGADAGIRIRVSGESQIYDWTVEIYDLRDGALLQSNKGACELCGRAEVVREFKSSLRDVAVATKLPAKKAPAKSKPTVSAQPQQKIEPRDVDPQPTEPVQREEMVMLEIAVEPADAAITVNGAPRGAGSATLALEEGTYEIQFAREGYRGLKETFVVGAQTSRRAFMRVHLSRTDPEVVAAAVSEGPIDRLGDQRVVYGALGTIVGAALLGTGAYFNHLDGRPTCDSGAFERCPTLYSTGGAAFITTLGGAVLATAGLGLLTWELIAGTSEDAPATATLAPVVTPAGAGLSLSGRF